MQDNETVESEQPAQVVDLSPLQQEIATLARELQERFGLHVQANDPAAMRFLALMAVLERKGIASLADVQQQMDEVLRDTLRAALVQAEATQAPETPEQARSRQFASRLAAVKGPGLIVPEHVQRPSRRLRD